MNIVRVDGTPFEPTPPPAPPPPTGYETAMALWHAAHMLRQIATRLEQASRAVDQAKEPSEALTAQITHLAHVVSMTDVQFADLPSNVMESNAT